MRILLRVKPFDVTTQEGRAQERYRLTVLAILVDVASTAVGAFAFLITVPLTLSYLGEERFGVWMTVASLAGLLSFLDMGIGNGLLNHVATTNATGDRNRLRRAVTHGLLLLCGIAFLVGLILIPAGYLLPLDRLVKIASPQAREELREMCFLFTVLFCLSVPINGIPKVFAGLQRTWQAHAVRGIGSLLSLILVVILAGEKAAPPALLLATYGIQVIAPLFLLVFLVRENVVGRTSVHDGPERSREGLLALTRVGGLFLVLQIGAMIGWGTDALILSSVLGAAEVAKYAVVQRLFQVVSVPLSIMNGPLWSAYADAAARGDRAFIAATLRRSMLVTAIMAVSASAALVAVSGWVFDIWLGRTIVVPVALVASYAVWIILEATGNAFAMFLNGAGVIRPQVVAVLCFCLLAIPLKILLPQTFGVAGIVVATVSAYLITFVGLYATIFRRDISRHVIRGE